MLVLLTSDQVMDYWELIKEGLCLTLPPYITKTDKLNEDMLMSFLSESAQCWVYLDKDSNVKCNLVTRRIYDDFTGSTYLELTSIYAPLKLTGEEWVEGFETIRKYAEGNNCLKIIAYSSDYTILRIAEKLGFTAIYTYMEYLL